jgi:DNA-binding transcriptional ArsR family regulator
LEKDNVSQDFDATKAELFEAISHPVRIKILEALNEKPMGFAELGRNVGIESGGHLSFHLAKLRHLIRTNPRGDYALTGEGKEALWTIHALQESGRQASAVAGRPSVRHRSLLKPIIAIILIVVIALGGFGLYQQGEFSSLQRQVSSQQGVIGALEGGIPFVIGQPASIVIGQKDFSASGEAISQTGLNTPAATVFDSSGDLWVVDSYNFRVLEFKPPFSDGMKASLVIGSRSFTTYGGPTGKDALSSPWAAAFDSRGDLWVADTGNSRVLEYTPPFADGMGASLVIGQPNFAARIAPISGSVLDAPIGITFDTTGSLWVYDVARVLEYNPPFNNGMNASVVLGQPDFSTMRMSSALDGLGSSFYGVNYLLAGFAVDSSNNMWIGDPVNNRILEFRPPFANGMNASLVIDQRNLVANKTSFAGHGFVQVPSYNLGTELVFDSHGNLWTNYNNRILAFKPPFIPEIRAFPTLEIGQPNFTATAWLGGQAGLFSPGQPSFDPCGNLWVPDSNNNRVLEFVANPEAGVTEQSPMGLGPIGLAVAAAATVGAIGALVAIWLSRRAHRRSNLS